MKKKIFIKTFTLAIICTLLLNTMVFASTAQDHYDAAEDARQRAEEALWNANMILAQAKAAPISETQVLFRDIPWYLTRSDVDKLLTDQGITVIPKDDPEEVTALNRTVYKLENVEPPHPVVGAGYLEKCENISVSQYEPATCGLCFMYTINEDGSVNKSDDEAEFYYGWYDFWSDDYDAEISKYTDLKDKLTSIYGEGVEVTNDYDQIFTNWYDYEGNRIQLYYSPNTTGEYHAVHLGYQAANAESRLNRLEDALGYVIKMPVETTYSEEDLSGL